MDHQPKKINKFRAMWPFEHCQPVRGVNHFTLNLFFLLLMVFSYLAAILPFLPFKQTPITTSSALTPYTMEWVHALEQIYNVFPHSSNSTKSDACLFDVPKFNCTSFYWDDGIEKRDVRHLRPQVRKYRLRFHFFDHDHRELIGKAGYQSCHIYRR